MSVPRPEQKYRQDVLSTVSAFLVSRSDVTQISMFGHPAFMASGRMFACLYDGGLGLKLAEPQIQEAMDRPNITTFRPYGKSMPKWVYIEHEDAAAYDDDLDLIEAAMTYAASGAANPARARAPRRRRAPRL